MAVSLLHSEGVLHYDEDNCGRHKLTLELGRDFGDYYLSLLPKYVKCNKPAYPAHVSVVRKDPLPRNKWFWGLYEGQVVGISYSPVFHFNEKYIWLNAFSMRLEAIRLGLGLEVTSPYTKPPDGYAKCFHITIANTKGLEYSEQSKP